MLKEMLGERELGLFAAALPVANVWTVIPSTLVTSLAPFVARKMRQDEQQYQDALAKIFRYFAVFSLLGAVLTSVASPWLIRLMYGVAYQSSAVILSTYVFVNVFVFQGVAQTLWVVNNNVRNITLLCTFLAAVTGVIANAVLIRKFGVMGAAYSILLTQGASVVVLPCLFRPDLRNLYKRAFLPCKVYR
jgi:O-antigen/teichoic acid export membrane protein